VHHLLRFDLVSIMASHTRNLPSATFGNNVRVLIIPGLGDSGPEHWQTWLASQYKGSRRVVQPDWQAPDLDTWSM
jgi:hypothetical protein